ncbi:SRPBCC family protein [Streptomyces cadmiisoli]|uniref:SRPBCC family protein n=1 Tax=Streptomyces cadmiisoli TaxID=2184053 RepID=UPI003D759F13
MADTGTKDRKSTAGDAKKAPTNRLVEELGTYAEARLEHMLTGVGHKMGDAAHRLGSAHLGPGRLVHAVGKGGKLGGQTASHAKESVKATATHARDTATHAKDTAVHAKEAVTEKVKDVTGMRHGPSSGSGAKSLTIIEDIDVGVPVRDAYDQWTQFTEFSSMTKGVVDVEQQDETRTQWQVKIAKASRAFTGTIIEQVPDERIAWTSEGAKGTTKGVVTFHPLGENLTKVLLVLEYYPKGIIEKTGGLVRAQGRRTRLDLKLFRKFVMMRGEATGGWRGEIREGEVVSEPDEDAEDEDRETRAEDADDERDERPEDGYDDRDDDAEDEFEDEDEEAEDEDEEDEDEEDGTPEERRGDEPADDRPRRRRR